MNAPPALFELKQNQTYEEWEVMLQLACEIDTHYIKFYLGDLIIQGRQEHPDKWTQALDPDRIRLSPETLRNYERVSRAFPPESGVRFPNLAHGVYSAFAKIPSDRVRFDLARQASGQGWTIRQATAARDGVHPARIIPRADMDRNLPAAPEEGEPEDGEPMEVQTSVGDWQAARRAAERVLAELRERRRDDGKFFTPSMGILADFFQLTIA